MAPLSEASKLALARLRQYTPPPTSWGSMPLSRRAAVLILLFPDSFGDLRVVLTMRASTLSSYSGHAALPGGKADTVDETPFQVARREAEEEVGLPRDPIPGSGKKSKLPKGFWVEEICEMPTNLAKTELVVRPCVAFLHNSTESARERKEGDSVVEGGSVEENMLPRLDSREVAAVFSAPFRNLLFVDDLPVKSEEGKEPEALPPGKWYEGSWVDWHQQRWRMHNFFVPVTNRLVHKPKLTNSDSNSNPTSSSTSSLSSDQQQQQKQNEEKVEKVKDHLEGLSRYRVWGMTARILVDCARLAYNQEPEFENNSHFGDENMIVRLRKMGRLGCKRKPGEVLTRDDLRAASHL